MKKLGMILLSFVAILFLVACGGKKVELTDYITVKYSGVDTRGTVSYYIDGQKLINDYQNQNKNTASKDLMELQQALAATTISVDKKEKLSNGEEIKFSLTFDKNLEKFVNAKKEKVVKVEGLMEAKKLTADFLKKNIDFKVDTSTYSTRGTATATITLKELSGLKLEVENNGQLTNGTDATVVVAKDQDEYLGNLGYVVDADSKATFAVANLIEVVDKWEDVKNKDEVIKKLQEEANKDYSSMKLVLEKTYYRGLTNTASNNYATDIVSSDGNIVMVFQKDSNFAYNKYVAVGFVRTSADKDKNIILKDVKIASMDFQTLDDATRKLESIGYIEVK